MAMSHIQSLLLLLASLFFLPALLAIATDFEYCNKSGYDYGNITQVETKLDGLSLQLTLKIFGYGSKTIDGTVVVSTKIGEYENPVNDYSLWEVTDTCPITPGTNFVLTLPEVACSYREPMAMCSVALIIDEDEMSKTAMCVDFKVPDSALELVSA